MARKQKFTAEQVEKALVDRMGTIALAADVLGCNALTVYRYLERYPRLKEVVAHFRERRVDKAELKLEEAIVKGEAWAIALTLKTLGKKRGYVERQEVEYDLSEQASETVERFEHAIIAGLASRRPIQDSNEQGQH